MAVIRGEPLRVWGHGQRTTDDLERSKKWQTNRSPSKWLQQKFSFQGKKKKNILYRRPEIIPLDIHREACRTASWLITRPTSPTKATSRPSPKSSLRIPALSPAFKLSLLHKKSRKKHGELSSRDKKENNNISSLFCDFFLVLWDHKKEDPFFQCFSSPADIKDFLP